jgi:hypothetical protein
LAFAAVPFTVESSFTPDRLGAPANLSVNAAFGADGTAPVPIGHVLAYGPAGLKVDVAGAGACQQSSLEKDGPAGCPADSRIGFGGGVGLERLGGELIKEPFTLDLFLAPRQAGRLAILLYVHATNPVAIELVILAKEVHGPKPYGFGVEFAVPPIATVPGAPYASVESGYLTVGSQHIAYYRGIAGHRRLVHVKGLIVPRSCPRGGFPFKVTVGFLDGSSNTDTYTAPCPRSRL